MSNYRALKTEIDTDSLGRGYAAMTDQQVADDLETAYRKRDRERVRGSDIANAIDVAEFKALPAGQQERVRWISQLGDGIDIKPGANVRAMLLDVFEDWTTTRTSLIAVAKESITRREEIAFGKVVTSQDVARVRGGG